MGGRVKINHKIYINLKYSLTVTLIRNPLALNPKLNRREEIIWDYFGERLDYSDPNSGLFYLTLWIIFHQIVDRSACP